MGCAASSAPVGPEPVLPSRERLIRQDEDGQRVCEASIHFQEPARSFDSMTHQITRRDRVLPPVAATHERHLAKLQLFLDVLPSHEIALRREVQVRRAAMARRRSP
mmetsp:Transcript_7572/g.18150  ORF Transcript_7572/g.18150 Transcript_7572/m.18150 type:complete len:106 (-) Transcript_7572:49-366(-)